MRFCYRQTKGLPTYLLTVVIVVVIAVVMVIVVVVVVVVMVIVVIVVTIIVVIVVVMVVDGAHCVGQKRRLLTHLPTAGDKIALGTKKCVPTYLLLARTQPNHN